jgi:hypothetical protein
MAMKPSDVPLVRGGELTPEMLDWIERVSEHFPGVEKDIIIVRKPIPAIPRGPEIGTPKSARITANA